MKTKTTMEKVSSACMVLIGAVAIALAVSIITEKDVSYSSHQGTVRYVDENLAKVELGLWETLNSKLPESVKIKESSLKTYAKENNGEKVNCTVKRTEQFGAATYEVTELKLN